MIYGRRRHPPRNLLCWPESSDSADDDGGRSLVRLFPLKQF